MTSEPFLIDGLRRGSASLCRGVDCGMVKGSGIADDVDCGRIGGSDIADQGDIGSKLDVDDIIRNLIYKFCGMDGQGKDEELKEESPHTHIGPWKFERSSIELDPGS